MFVFVHVERLGCKHKGRNRGVCLWRCVREIWVCVCGERDMVGCVCVGTGMGLVVERVGYVWRERRVSENVDRDSGVLRS